MFLLHLRLTVQHFFPNLLEELKLLPDHRKQQWFTVAELSMAAISMFLLKRGSRNAMNEISEKQMFTDNYKKLFGLDFPHMDAVEDYFRQLSTEHISKIKHRMVQLLLEKKTLHKFRLLDIYHIIAIDGVTLCSYDYEPYPGCTFREHQSGKKTWSVNVIEAKLVYSNGFSISVASEFIINEDEYIKQNCEKVEAIRLCETIKKLFPSLPICLVADGLYPSEPYFELCKKYQWAYIFTLKDNCLESIWQEVRVGLCLQYKNKTIRQLCHKNKWTFSKWRFVNKIPYHKKFIVNWVECVQSIYNKKTKKDELSRFVHVTNIDITKENVIQVSDGGRLRWKIENEGFNEQKNHGYNLKHKYSRNNLNAAQNYYQCLQIAHMITQLCTKCQAVKDFKGRVSEKSLWEDMIAELMKIEICEKDIEHILCLNCQFRY